MNNLIDSLVNVSISISNSTANVSAFNNLLLLDFEGVSGSEGLNEFTTILDVKYAKWDEDSDIYKAANIAFKNGAEVLYIYSAADGESVADALEKAGKNSGWYGFTIIEKPTDNGHTLPSTDELEEAAAWAEDNHKLFGFVTDIDGADLKNGTAEDGSDLMPFDTDSDKETHYYSVAYATNLTDNPDNYFIAVAAFSKNMTYQPGSETWAYKTLSGIEPDEFDSEDAESLEYYGFNAYANCAGKDITLNGKVVSGEWTDIIRFRDWLVDDIQTRVFNVFTENTKVPYSTAGITMIENQIITSLKTGQNVGGIATTEYDDAGNKVEGYTVTMPAISSVKETDRQARFLRGCSFTARLQGAIHLVEITGVLTT